MRRVYAQCERHRVVLATRTQHWAALLRRGAFQVYETIGAGTLQPFQQFTEHHIRGTNQMAFSPALFVGFMPHCDGETCSFVNTMEGERELEVGILAIATERYFVWWLRDVYNCD